MFENATKVISNAMSAQTTDGYKIFWEILRLRNSYLIYLDNKIALSNELIHFEEYFSSLSTSEKNTRRRQRAISKNIFNMIASAQALKEHLRINCEKLCSPPSNKNSFYLFRELRNYIIHQASFPLISKRSGKIVKNERILIVTHHFDMPRMLDFISNKKDNPNISQKQKKQLEDLVEFIRDLPEDLSFTKMIQDFDREVIDFYKRWVISYVKLNRKNLLKLEETALQIHSMPIDEKGSKIINLPINIYQRRWLKILLKSKYFINQGIL